ncbi:MAG: HAD-IA family hydrolase [Nitrospirae bacterium]|nr:HAD-IA family hydrolase [Nitrospirota bacterium]
MAPSGGGITSGSTPACRPVRAIVFDLDGTLIDSREDLANAVNHTIEHFGYRPLSPETIYGFIGRGVGPLLQDTLQTAGVDLSRVDGALIEQGRTVFLDYYSRHLLDHTQLYPGVREVLDHFSSKTLAVLTNKPEEQSRKILEGLGVAQRFSRIFGGDTLPYRKPDPETLLEALRILGHAPGDAAFIGDSLIDLETGRRAGVFTCLVSYGLGAREDLVKGNPDLMVEKPLDLIHYLA